MHKRNITLYTKPIPLNAMYRSYNGRTILSKRGRETKDALATELLVLGRIEPMMGTVGLNLTLHFGDKRRRDIDGYLKVLLDALEGVVYKDDVQIVELHVYKLYSKEDPRVEIEWWEIDKDAEMMFYTD